LSELTPLLEVDDLRVQFPARDGGAPVRAVDGVGLRLPVGETLGLVGESGCGKSTTGRAILRLVRAAGQCRFDGEDVFGFGPARLRQFRSEAQLVFQDPFSSLNPRFTVRQTLAEPLLIHRRCPRRQLRDRVAELLLRVGLQPDLADRFPHQFSGGQRQRIGIARALAVEPRLVVCDEPVSALDVTVQAQVVDLLADLQRELSLSYVFIAHDLAVVRHISQRVAVMYLGRIVETGHRDAIYDAPRHPYTAALLSAVPVPEPGATSHRILLSGDVPSPTAVPSGCRFHPRCPLAEPRCTTESPELREVASRQVACHLAEGVTEWLAARADGSAP